VQHVCCLPIPPPLRHGARVSRLAVCGKACPGPRCEHSRRVAARRRSINRWRGPDWVAQATKRAVCDYLGAHGERETRSLSSTQLRDMHSDTRVDVWIAYSTVHLKLLHVGGTSYWRDASAVTGMLLCMERCQHGRRGWDVGQGPPHDCIGGR
jgi:hypothetical protein